MFSLRDEVVLSLQAAKIMTKNGRLLSGNVFAVGGERLLKSVAIFGANASGKSNIVKAIRACVGLIRNSHNNNEGTDFGIVPFKFEGYDRKPSEFYVRFLLEGVEYEYSFVVTRTEVWKEQLYYYPNGRRSLVFSRDETRGEDKKDVYEFKSVVKRPMDVAANTSKKTLFISRASQMDRDVAKRVYRFFSEDVVVDYNRSMEGLSELVEERREEMLEILRTVDSDIVDVRMQGGVLKTFHKSNPDIVFDFESEESDGTKTLFKMMMSLIDVIRKGRVLFVDEIDTSLHTQLVEYLIGIFNSSESAQIVYTTHNTHLLSSDFQRRDQVYFVNKRSDGSSDLYSLYDYKDYRDTYDMEKAYLQGRFDAVPYLCRPEF